MPPDNRLGLHDGHRIKNSRCNRQHSAAADPRRIAPSLRPDLISDTDTFVAKIERGERRIDVIEFIAIARAIGRDPMRLLKQYLEQERPSKPRSGPRR